MAVATAHHDQGIGTGDPQSSNSFTATSGGVLWVTVSMSFASGAPDDAMSVSGLSGTFTQMGTQTWGSRRRTWWFRAVGASGTGTLSFDYTGAGTVQEIGWVIDESTGADTTTPAAGFTAASGNSNGGRTITTVTSPAAGDGTYSSIAGEDNIDYSPEAGWTALGATTTGSLGVRRIESAWDADADQSSAWTWSGTIGNGGAIWIIKAATGGGGSSILRQMMMHN